MTPAMYRRLTIIASPLIALLLRWRRTMGKEDPDRAGERVGVPSAPRPEGSLIWIHAASVGETFSALPLAERITDMVAGANLLFTTGTVSSARLLADRLPARSRHQYVPVDRPKDVRRFIRHWRPNLSLWMESELWPNLIGETHAHGNPMVLVNGRMSRRSASRWRKFPRLIEAVLADFSLCLAQSDAEAVRYRALGAKVVRSPGNLKAATPPLPCDEDALGDIRRSIAGRPVWLAASTHAGEEMAAAAVHRALATDHANLLTIIVPRHAHRAGKIRRQIEALGLAVVRRSRDERLAPESEIYLADTLGELGLFFCLCDVVFVGGSLIRHGGQNLLEPARLGCAVIHGPHMSNFVEVVDAFSRGSAAVQVPDAAGLTAIVGTLLSDHAERRRMQVAASEVAANEAGVLDAYIAELRPYLDALARKGKDVGANVAGAAEPAGSGSRASA